jgi:hypothetical protein
MVTGGAAALVLMLITVGPRRDLDSMAHLECVGDEAALCSERDWCRSTFFGALDAPRFEEWDEPGTYLLALHCDHRSGHRTDA